MGKFVWQVMVHFVLNNLYNQTGKDLLYKDEKVLEECILFKISEASGEWMKVLRKFKYRTLVSCPHNDLSVPFTSSSISSHNPYPITKSKTPEFFVEGHDGFDEEYSSIIPNPRYHFHQEQKEKAVEKEDEREEIAEELFLSDNVKHVSFPKKVLENLLQLKWRRLDVQFLGVPSILVHDLPLGKINKLYSALKMMGYATKEESKKFISIFVDIIERDFC